MTSKELAPVYQQTYENTYREEDPYKRVGLGWARIEPLDPEDMEKLLTLLDKFKIERESLQESEKA